VGRGGGQGQKDGENLAGWLGKKDAAITFLLSTGEQILQKLWNPAELFFYFCCHKLPQI
jgi:hypothetical protein